MYPHTRIDLPSLTPEQASVLVDLLDAALAAIWQTHGDAIAHLEHLRRDGDHDASDDCMPELLW